MRCQPYTGKRYFPEELRFKYLQAQKAGQLDQYTAEVQARNSDIQVCMQEVKSHPDIAVRFLQKCTQDIKELGHRTIQQDFIKFPVGSQNQASSLNKTGNFNNTTTGMFGVSGFSGTGPAAGAGTSSGLGNGLNMTSSAFGKPAFGNTATSSGGGFGSSSFGSSAFGAPAFGSGSTGSGFGSLTAGNQSNGASEPRVLHLVSLHLVVWDKQHLVKQFRPIPTNHLLEVFPILLGIVYRTHHHSVL